jgi:hypothetical protein
VTKNYPEQVLHPPRQGIHLELLKNAVDRQEVQTVALNRKYF